MGVFPEVTTIDGAYEWLLILTVLFAALLWVIIAASYFGWLPMLDRLGGGGAAILPLAGPLVA